MLGFPGEPWQVKHKISVPIIRISKNHFSRAVEMPGQSKHKGTTSISSSPRTWLTKPSVWSRSRSLQRKDQPLMFGHFLQNPTFGKRAWRTDNEQRNKMQINHTARGFLSFHAIVLHYLPEVNPTLPALCLGRPHMMSGIVFQVSQRQIMISVHTSAMVAEKSCFQTETELG